MRGQLAPAILTQINPPAASSVPFTSVIPSPLSVPLIPNNFQHPSPLSATTNNTQIQNKENRAGSLNCPFVNLLCDTETFRTTPRVLSQIPAPLLHAMDANNYFIDYDSNTFKHLLKFYREGIFCFDGLHERQIVEIRAAATYFKASELLDQLASYERSKRNLSWLAEERHTYEIPNTNLVLLLAKDNWWCASQTFELPRGFEWCSVVDFCKEMLKEKSKLIREIGQDAISFEDRKEFGFIGHIRDSWYKLFFIFNDTDKTRLCLPSDSILKEDVSTYECLIHLTEEKLARYLLNKTFEHSGLNVEMLEVTPLLRLREGFAGLVCKKTTK